MGGDQLSLFGAPTPEPEQAPLPDAAARRRIAEDLHTNLIVEAGAGAGKTTEMVRRMVALIRSGTAEVGTIAAVTFTRKAAAELRERFQTALETELRRALAKQEDAAADRLDAALREIDRAFLGTIHAFCARLLRERPLDAGVDPAFRETMGAEELRLQRRFWLGWLEHLAADGDAGLDELRSAGLAPQQLEKLFAELSRQPDVTWPAERVARPDASALRRRIESLMDAAASIMPVEEPPGGWDRLQNTLRMLRFHRFILGWADDARFLDAVAPLVKSSFKVTKRQWKDGDAARVIEGQLCELFEDGGAVNAMLRQWWAYRYPLATEFAAAAAASYEVERRRAGFLNFQDLLMYAARLLRQSPAARRELSERYRYLLVDEFQDTDPIQAEVLFLLASDEELDLFPESAGATPAEWRPLSASWRHLTPRPGALFLVGDPKQSIYRFRRADMTLYQQVRRRFDVVELTANFRSRPAIESFVNAAFEERFPAESTEVQARFAPMQVQYRDEPGVVCWYELDDPVNSPVAELAGQDADRLATFIGQRIEAGERRPGDFLVLTPNTKWLGRYAAALERRNIPVQVTGAGVGGRQNVELQELRLLLRALCDPGDSSLVVAVLTGLFFGLDYEQLVRHAEVAEGAAFSFTKPWPEPVTPVQQALAVLNRFWLQARAEPADIVVARIVDELGLLPFAAAGELGESRAGALLYALDAVRATAVYGDASLAGALYALDAALDEADSEAPLEPGRGDVVRVMNLHKAKGLEAPVTVLAAPFGDWSPVPTHRVVRDEAGRALGFTTVFEERGFDQRATLAQPLDWHTHVAEERRFGEAEDERLLYVAATRAGQELIVGCAYNMRSPSPWRSFYPWLKAHGTPLVLPQPVRAERVELHVAAEAIMDQIHRAHAARREHGRPTYRVAAITARKTDVTGAGDAVAGEAEHGTGSGRDQGPSAGVARRGADWGTAVHDALQLAAEGMQGDALRSACRDRLIALDRPTDPDGEPAELDELLGTVLAVLNSPVWQRALQSERVLLEVPFALRVSAAGYASMIGAPPPPEDAPWELLDGRIDLAYREDAGWVIVDYKTDAAGEDIPAELMQRYRAQLALYAAAWQRITGEPVAGTSLLFTQGLAAGT
jgi:ATP-dependent helicase/nuclease subunit A